MYDNFMLINTCDEYTTWLDAYQTSGVVTAGGGVGGGGDDVPNVVPVVWIGGMSMVLTDKWSIMKINMCTLLTAKTYSIPGHREQ